MSEKPKKKNIVQAATELFGDTVENLGYELWNIEYYKEPTEWILEVTIEKDGGVSIDDCEKVHRAIEPIIDEADPIENSYSLQVSSPGLNKKKKKDFHIDRYVNREVTVRLFAKHELIKEKAFRGVLLEHDGENIKIEANLTGGKNDERQTEVITFTRKEIAHIYAYDEINF
jgi:ribosome maturation factor RimP